MRRELFPTFCAIVSAIACLLGGYALNSPVTIGFGWVTLGAALGLGTVIYVTSKRRQ